MATGRYKPKTAYFRKNYIGRGVGPIKQNGKIYTLRVLRDEARRLIRSLTTGEAERFMSRIKVVGIHAPPKERDWDFCPMKHAKGFCIGCSDIFVVEDLNINRYRLNKQEQEQHETHN